MEEAIRSGYDIEQIFANPGSKLSQAFKEIGDREMELITQLTSPSPALAIVHIPAASFNWEAIKKQRTIILDGVRDPGNLGTIIRTADWFGINHVILLNDCVDVYNSKVVQATMGSLFRVVVYAAQIEELKGFLKDAGNFEMVGGVLDGDSTSTLSSITEGALIIGSEADGISEEVQNLLTKRITIAGGQETESLNAAISAAILIHEWTR
ncbi:MAG: hypothetical protein Salg2KO_12240 [Salibacteraceae bacterium]